jgi:predicted RNase H-like HicB family nuclease
MPKRIAENVMAKPIKYTVSDGKLVLTLEVCDEGGYIVTVPMNPEVFTQADSVEEAFEMARDAIAIWNDIHSEEIKEIKAKRRGKQPVR